MKIARILSNHISLARNNTGNAYYDKTYPKLLEAGNKLLAGHGGENETLTLAHGIAGWNRGYGTAPNAEYLINHLSDTSNLSKLARSISCVENADKNSGDLEGNISEALKLAQQALNIKTEGAVTIASKLLHFFSPKHFPLLDANVENALRQDGIDEVSYNSYAVNLIRIGVADLLPTENRLAVYWSWLPVVTPIRAIDCTLYVVGKR